MNKEEREAIEDFIDLGLDIAGRMAGASIGFAAGGLPGALLGAASTPALSRAFKEIGKEFSNRLFGEREKMRIGAATVFALDKINENISLGKQLRQDGFFEKDIDGRSPSDEILEGVYLKSRLSHEENKIKHYGYFFANIAFDESCGTSEANYLLSLYERLTYRQLCLLTVFSNSAAYPLRNHNFMGATVYPNVWAILQEIYDLYQLNLIRFKDKEDNGLFWGLGPITPSKASTTGLGNSLLVRFELQKIPRETLNEAIQLIKI